MDIFVAHKKHGLWLVETSQAPCDIPRVLTSDDAMMHEAVIAEIVRPYF